MTRIPYRIHITGLCLSLLATGCAEQNQRSDAAGAQMPEITIEALASGLDAHGGVDTWRSFGRVEFHVEKGDLIEHNTVDLKSRELLLASQEYLIGFDGEDVWVSPGGAAYPGDARFYSSLNFYFFGLPFLLADPGTIHEDFGQRQVGDVTYNVVKVSFEEGVGDSPNDYYLAHFNSETGTMDLLLYTVTFRSGEPHEDYNARVYTWQEVQGLLVPETMSSYRWDADRDMLGDHRSDTHISKVMFSAERPEPEWFARPSDSEIAPMPTTP